MSEHPVTILPRDLPVQYQRPFDLLRMLDAYNAILSTDHPASSRGIPVLIYPPHVLGPADVPGLVLHAYHDTPEEIIRAALLAGWSVALYQA